MRDDQEIILIEREADRLIVADAQVERVLVTEQEVIQQTVSLTNLDVIVVNQLDDGYAAIESEPDIVVVSVSEQGPPGRNGLNGGATIEISFAFGDATPVPVIMIGANLIIYEIGIHISIPFDGVGASLVVGDVDQADRLMKAHENDPTQIGSNTTAPAYFYTETTSLNLSISPGEGATKGAGLLVIKTQQ